MSEIQKQALLKFGAGLIAAVLGIVAAAISSEEFRDLVVGFFGGDGIVTGLILAATTPIVLYIGKLAAGLTQKVPTETVAGAEVRGAKVPSGAKGPGLFG